MGHAQDCDSAVNELGKSTDDDKVVFSKARATLNSHSVRGAKEWAAVPEGNWAISSI
jgi:hypothetical protein